MKREHASNTKCSFVEIHQLWKLCLLHVIFDTGTTCCLEIQPSTTEQNLADA